MARIGLTRQQADLLAFIEAYGAEHDGAAPCYDEMMAHLGYSSKASVHRLLTVLEERGAIRRSFNKARSIVLVDQASRFRPGVEASISEYCRIHRCDREFAINRAVEMFFGSVA